MDCRKDLEYLLACSHCGSSISEDDEMSVFESDLIFCNEKCKALYIARYDLCPECLMRLESTFVREYRGECHGTPAYEPMTYYKCLDCGWES